MAIVNVIPVLVTICLMSPYEVCDTKEFSKSSSIIHDSVQTID